MSAVEQTLKEIKATVFSLRDGATAASMRQKGAGGALNMGLSIPQIREVATGYPPSRELSDALLHHQMRELKLLGILLFPKDDADAVQIVRLLREVSSREAAELLAYHLVAPAHNFDSILQSLLATSTTPYASETAYNALARRLLTELPLSRESIERALDAIETAPELPPSALHLAIRLAETPQTRELIKERLLQWNKGNRDILKRLSAVLSETADLH